MNSVIVGKFRIVLTVFPRGREGRELSLERGLALAFSLERERRRDERREGMVEPQYIP